MNTFRFSRTAIELGPDSSRVSDVRRPETQCVRSFFGELVRDGQAQPGRTPDQGEDKSCPISSRLDASPAGWQIHRHFDLLIEVSRAYVLSAGHRCPSTSLQFHTLFTIRHMPQPKRSSDTRGQVKPAAASAWSASGVERLIRLGGTMAACSRSKDLRNV